MRALTFSLLVILRRFHLHWALFQTQTIRVVVIFEVRNFLAPNPGICEVPVGNPLGKIIYESVHIYPVFNDLEVSRNVI